MQSPYSHHDHAGNRADVHKHWLLHLLLTHHSPGEGDFLYLDTHAGCGCYSRHSSGGKDPFCEGIERLWQAESLPQSIAAYMQTVCHFNRTGKLQRYPGSPEIVRQRLGENGRALLYEIHPDYCQELQRNLENDSRIEIRHGDGFEGVTTQAMSGSQRKLILLDPPYIDRKDFTRVAGLPTGIAPDTVFAIWYPLLADQIHRRLKLKLGQQFGESAWACELHWQAKRSGSMLGSGMLLLNAGKAVIREAERDGEELAARLEGRIRYWRPS